MIKRSYFANILSHASFVISMFAFSLIAAISDEKHALIYLTFLISASAVFSTFFDCIYYTGKKTSDKNDFFLAIVTILILLLTLLVSGNKSYLVLGFISILYGYGISARSFIHRCYIESGHIKELSYISIFSLLINASLLLNYFIQRINLFETLIMISVNNLFPVIAWKLFRKADKAEIMRVDFKHLIYAISVSFRLNSPILLAFLFGTKSGGAIESISTAVLLCRPLSHFYPMISTVTLVAFKSANFSIHFFLHFIKKVAFVATSYCAVIILLGGILSKYLSLNVTFEVKIIMVILATQTVVGIVRSLSDFRILQNNDSQSLSNIAFVSLVLCVFVIIIIGLAFGFAYSYIGLLISEIFYVAAVNRNFFLNITNISINDKPN